MGLLIAAILLVIVLVVLVRCIVIVPQSNSFVVERLGVYKATWEAGLHLKMPFIERVARRVSLKEEVADFPPQPVITRDNVTMMIDTVVFFQVFDAKAYAYGVSRPIQAIENLSATSLRDIIGSMSLDETLTSRDAINTQITATLDEATDRWGIKVNRIELKNIEPPTEIRQAMEKQMKADREKRASILLAEGEKQAAITRAEGEKESAILRAEAVKEQKIREAEGQAQALLLDTLPRQVMRVDEILSFCGFPPDTRLPDYDGCRMFDLRQRPADAELTKLLLRICALSRGTAGLAVRESAARVRAYLRDFDLTRPGTMLVDIGSGGTTQRVLQELCGAPLHGLYLACDERLFERLPRTDAQVCLFGGEPAPLWFWMAQPLLEYLISEPCGPTLGYHEAGTSVSPVREPVAPPAELLAVQRGVLRFAKEWSASSLNGLELSPDRTILPFLRMARRPALRQAVCFGDFTLEDGVSFRLAAPAPLTAYLRNPARLARDFKDSRWKIGFLRRLLRLPLPYDAVYSLLKGGSAPGKDG